jgi:hypothetical protein
MKEAVQDTLFPMPPAMLIDGKGMTAVQRWKLYLEQSEVQGGLIPQAIVPDVLGLSRQRMYDLIEDGRLKVLQLFGLRFITGPSFEAFVLSERKSGRPVKNPGNLSLLKTSMKGALAVHKEMKGKGK